MPRTRRGYLTLFVRLYVLMAALAIGLGVAFGVGGPRRFSLPSFEGPRNLVSWLPFPPHLVWATLFMAYGLALVFVMGKSAAVHFLRLGVALHLFLMVSFFRSAVMDQHVSMSGIVAYTVFAIAHLFLSDHLANRGWEG